jgi:signal transduction histidine kinase
LIASARHGAANRKRLEIFQTAIFRTSAMASAAIGVGTLLLFAFIYWQSAVWESARVGSFLQHESQAIQREALGRVIGDVETRFARDLHRQSFAAVFDAGLHLQGGDLVSYPAYLPLDGLVHQVTVARQGADSEPSVEEVEALASVLRDGRILVVGRSVEDLVKLRHVVLRALALGLLPGLLLALCAGTFASARTLNRVRSVNRSVARIMQGNLRERLESRGTEDALDQLAGSVNRMLDEIERLIEEIGGVGDDIAHDLRTPLTRVRARLERGMKSADSQEAWQAVTGQAIADLDQALATITALLRIGQIEAGLRRAGFVTVDLCEVAREAADFYRPLAELRGILLEGPGDHAAAVQVHGDPALLFEVAANLLDNAVKFTPEGGRVDVTAIEDAGGPMMTVYDTGPGIPKAERTLVLKRFHRGDRSRHVPGSGLGLNLVAAIVRLHGFHLHMDDAAPGLVVQVRCWAEGGLTKTDAADFVTGHSSGPEVGLSHL